VGLGIARVRGEYLAKAGGRFIDATLLEKSIGLGYVARRKRNAEEKEAKGKSVIRPEVR